MSITCGIDWAEAHHDVALVDHDGKVVARARVDTDVAGFAAVLELIVEHGGSPASTPIAIETVKLTSTYSSWRWRRQVHCPPDQPAVGRALPGATQSGRREV